MSDDSRPTVRISLPRLGELTGFKSGAGLMGRTAHIVVACTVAAVGVGGPLAFLNAWAAVAALALCLGVALFAISKAYGVVEKNPELALLEGAELIKKYKLDQAAKNPEIIDASARQVGSNHPPAALTQDKGRNGA